MRVGTLTLSQQGLAQILDQQSKIARSQQQVSSGLKYNTAADNPGEFTQGLTLDDALAQLDQFKQNADIVTGRLGLEENALASTGDILQRVRELLVQAGNAS